MDDSNNPKCPKHPCRAPDAHAADRKGRQRQASTPGERPAGTAAPIVTLPNLLDRVLEFRVRDFSAFALQPHSQASSTEGRMAVYRSVLRKPAIDAARYNAAWVRAHRSTAASRPGCAI